MADDAVLTGDKIGNEVVECFACRRIGPGEVRRDHDTAVVVSSTTSREREISLEAAKQQRTDTSGQRPILRLPEAHITKPLSKDFHMRIMGRIRAVTVEAWRKGSRVEEPVVNTLNRVIRNGYDIWAIGGLVRDTLREDFGTPPAEIGGDLDLVGSLPPGRFAEDMREFVGRAELPIRFNPFSGVVAVSRDASGGERVLEYAPLKDTARKGSNSLMFGCDLQIDASWRDLTVNTVAYDWNSELLADPTGRGMNDLRAMTLRAPAIPKDRPGFRAHLLFRYFKFVRRWPDASVRALGAMLQEEFAKFREDVKMLPDTQIKGLLKPFGATREAQIETVLALGARLAPSCDWDGMFTDAIERLT